MIVENLRFEDEGKFLWDFADLSLVRCPRCGAMAQVEHLREEGRWTGQARVRCAGCGFAKSPEGPRTRWYGPVTVSAQRRCGRCGKQLSSPRRRLAHLPAKNVIALRCPDCGAESNATLGWTPHPPMEPHDPFFGIPLWLQVPCCGEILWAYNSAHLDFLEGYVGAALRERVPRKNSSHVSRMPLWIKRAGNREAILAGLGKLRELLAA